MTELSEDALTEIKRHGHEALETLSEIVLKEAKAFEKEEGRDITKAEELTLLTKGFVHLVTGLLEAHGITMGVLLPLDISNVLEQAQNRITYIG